MRNATILMAFLMSATIGGGFAQQTATPPASSKPAVAGAASAPVTAPYGLTPQDKTRKNPVKFTTDSVEQGKKLYASQCAMCHGATANGKGDLAAALKMSLPDFTKAAVLSKYADGELFKIISVGGGMMPGQGKRLSDTHIWDLVNFLRSVGGTVPAATVASTAATKTPK
jgi:mono/diheme cytochrome c family protein